MFHNRKKHILFIILLLGVGVFLWIKSEKEEPFRSFYSDLKTLQDSGYIRVGVLQNTTDYYLDRGAISGFQYEMVEQMAKHLGLRPHYVVYNTYWEHFYALWNNEVDVLAMNLNSILDREQFFRYTFPYFYSEDVLVQRKKDLFINENLKINPDSDSLSGKKIVLGVPAFSVFYRDALRLLYHTDNRLEMKVYNSFNTNDMLAMLDTGGIDVFITDAQIMKSNALLYPELDYSVALTEDLPQSWAVHEGNASLCDAISQWTEAFVNTLEYKRLLTKYFSTQSLNRQRAGQQRQRSMQGAISPYDEVIKKEAKEKSLDWRFVAAIMFQESRFNPTVEGRGGSYGLMQTMPSTAQHLGTEVNSSEENQIADGCKHIHKIMEKYRDKYLYEEDLLKITLVAYNTGNGNVDAARKLAKEKGLNPNCWENIEYVLRNASDKSFTNGRSQIKGKAALRYVYKVWIHYIHYKNINE